MTTHAENPKAHEEADHETGIGRLLNEAWKTAKERAQDAKRIASEHPVLVAAAAAFLSGIWLGRKLGK